jgi:hypothetical protein
MSGWSWIGVPSTLQRLAAMLPISTPAQYAVPGSNAWQSGVSVVSIPSPMTIRRRSPGEQRDRAALLAAAHLLARPRLALLVGRQHQLALRPAPGRSRSCARRRTGRAGRPRSPAASAARSAPASPGPMCSVRQPLVAALGVLELLGPRQLGVEAAARRTPWADGRRDRWPARRDSRSRPAPAERLRRRPDPAPSCRARSR